MQTKSSPPKSGPSVDPSCGECGFQARPREDLDALFHRGAQEFSGGDGDRSIPLDDGRSLWLFGDTLVGPRKNVNHLVMPRNSVGVLQRNGVGDLAFAYYWRERDGIPSAYFVSPRRGQWLWPGAACSVNGAILFFLMRMRTDNSARFEAFNFKYLGFEMFRADGTHLSPDRWTISAVPAKIAGGVLWGSACHPAEDGFVYLLGAAYGTPRRGTVVARLPFENLEDACCDQWEYWTNSGGNPSWTRSHRGLELILPEASSELSLSYLPDENLFLAIYAFHEDGRILARTARDLMGPWSSPRPIYVPPELEWNSRYFCYAPKAHPEMDIGNGEIPITYITNAYEERYLVEDQRIYYPRFISISRSEIVDCAAD